jgi:peptidoglycan/LPS O-acetylase OafA/YrhL
MRTIQLDALRAFAFLAVLFEHYGGFLNAHLPLGGGVLGVGLFFVLSGFLITSLLLKSFDAYSHEPGSALINFYLRRALRLMPPFYLTLAILVLLHIEPIASSWYWHASYLTNFWIVAGHPANVLWSLAVEEQFYLFWPLALLFTPRRHVLSLAVCAAALGFVFKLVACLALGFRPIDVTFLLPSNLGLLSIGSALAILSYRDGMAFQFAWFTPRISRVLGVFAIIGIAGATLLWQIDGPVHVASFLAFEWLVGPAFAWLIIRTAQGWSGMGGLLMGNPVILYIGRISYTLYLIHNFIPGVIEQFTGPLPRATLLVVTLVVLFAAASFSWFFIEKPLLRLKVFFPNTPRRRETLAAIAL